jgi:tetratricopeptide (TPR) repeat protein
MQKILFIFLLLIFISPCTNVFAQENSYEKNCRMGIENYTKLIKKGGSKLFLASLYSKRATNYVGLKKIDEAIKDDKMAITLDPQNGYTYWDLGNIYNQKGDFEQALASYKKSISILKDKLGINELEIVYCNAAQDEYMLKRYPEALTYDSLSIVANNQYSRAYDLAGDIHMMMQDFAGAEKDYTNAMMNIKNPDGQEVSILFTKRADARRNSKRLKDAINDYSLAIKAFAANGIAYWNRAATYHLNSDYELATADYTKAMEFYKGNNENLSKLYDDRAVNELGQNLNVQAIQDDSIAIAMNVNNRLAYFNLANAYTQNANYQKGIDVINKLKPFFLDQKNVLALLYYNIANNEYFLNQFDKVVDDCSKAIELDPAYPSPYYYRAKVYLKKKNDKQLATSDFNKVIQLDTTKKTIDYVFSLFYVGRGDEAVVILQDDVLSTTDNAVVLGDYYNLACLYSLMNKPDEANIYLKKALDGGYEKKYAVADEDLDNIRNTDDYKTTMGIGKSQ